MKDPKDMTREELEAEVFGLRLQLAQAQRATGYRDDVNSQLSYDPIGDQLGRMGDE